MMNAKILMIGAVALAVAPATVSAQTAPGNGQNNGTGYWHSTGPSPDQVGQPNQDCEDLIANGDGSFPGHAGDNGSSAFGGSAGDVYAGSQPQNSRNSVSVSQYDVGCLAGTKSLGG
jgi:hypothetical protein